MQAENTDEPDESTGTQTSPRDAAEARITDASGAIETKVEIDRETAEEVARPDALIHLDPNRKNLNADAFRVEQDFQLSQQQFNILQDATGSIQDAAGVYQSMLGKDNKAESGVAINSPRSTGSPGATMGSAAVTGPSAGLEHSGTRTVSGSSAGSMTAARRVSGSQTMYENVELSSCSTQRTCGFMADTSALLKTVISLDCSVI